MISSSSSVCDCGYQFAYTIDNPHGPEVGNQWGNGFYPHMGQPLVYYAQVHQSMTKNRRSRESRNGKPNYFSNAFHWYNKTQDLQRVDDRNSAKTDMNSFAVWLDGKYEEFLRESDRGQGRLNTKKTSTVVTPKMASNPTNKAKRERRWSSPWKRRRNAKNKEYDARYDQPKHSFEYILQPKQLNKTNSEYYQLNRPNFNNQSNATTTTCELGKGPKQSVKSQSMSNIRNKDSKHPLDFYTTPEGAVMEYSNNSYTEAYLNPAHGRQYEDVKISKNHKCLCPNKSLNRKSSSSRKQRPKEVKVSVDHKCVCPEEPLDSERSVQIHEEQLDKISVYVDVSCQCITEAYGIPMSDAHCQHEQEITPHYNPRCEKAQHAEKAYQYHEPMPPAIKEPPVQSVMHDAKLINPRSPNSYTILVDGRNQSCKLLLNDGAQTSDHSINLEKDVIGIQPHILKIYRTQKNS